MKTIKLVLGIISMVLFVIVIFQSCAAGLGNALSQNGESSGSSGFVLAIFMLIAGIVGVTTRKGGKGGAITAAVFYILGGLIAIVNVGSFSDLAVWAWVNFIFGAIFIIGSFLPNKQKEEITE